MTNEARRLLAAMESTEGAATRIESSLSDDRELLVAAIEHPDTPLDRTTLLVVDAFVQRFQQMTEHMLHRLYPALYRAEELGERPPATRTLLIWLEELGLIDGGRDWRERTEARNRLVHEYPLDSQDRSAALRTAVDHGSGMLADYRNVLNWIELRGLTRAADSSSSKGGAE